MYFFDVVQRRYSHRTEFSDAPVQTEDLRRILEAGLAAPSGKNAQTTTFVVVTNQELKEEIASLLPTPAVKTAPVILVILSEKLPVFHNISFETEDYAAAVENILLAVTALGYATVWMDGLTRWEQKGDAIASLLQVPSGKTVRTILPIGVPLQWGEPKEKKPFSERVYFNRCSS